MDAGMSAASRAQSRRTSMLGGLTPSMRPVGRDTPRSRLHNQLAGSTFDTTPVVPIFDDFVGPGWDAESVATTRAGSTRPPPHPHTTPRHAMQPSVEDAPPSGLNSGLHSPLLGGGVLESKRNSGMETVLEEPVAGPSTFPHVALSVDPPDGGDPTAAGGGSGGESRSRASSRRTASSGRRRREGDEHQPDSGWGAFDAQAAGGSGWDDGGGGGGSWGFGDAGGGGGGGGGSGWLDEPPPLAHGLGLSGATASQQGSRRPSDASLYVQDPSQPPSRPRSRTHSRAPSGGTTARSPVPAAPSLAPPAHVRSPTLSDMHGANIFHVPVGSPTQATSPPRPSPIRTNITPTRSNPTPARSGRLPAQTPVIARDYALPEHLRVVPLASDGTPRFLPVRTTPPAGVSSPARALREAFVGNGAPRHPAAALQAHPPEPEPEPEPEPPQAQPEDEPVVPGKKGFLARVSSMLNRDRAVAKDKPPAPRRVKKKKGKGAVEEMLAEEWGAEAGPSTLGDAPPAAEADAGAAAAHAEEEERRKAQEEEDRKKAAEEDEKRRKEEAELALKAAEEAARLASEEHRRQQEIEEEQRRRDEEEEAAARARHEAVEAEHAQVLSQHGDAPPDPPAEEQADKGKGGWFKRKGTKKLKKGPKPPTPPPPEPSPFNLPPLESAADPGGSSAPPPAPASPQPTFDAPPSPPRTFASPHPTFGTTAHGHAPTVLEFSGAPHEEHREFVYVPSVASPSRGHGQAYSVHVSTPPGARRSPTQHLYAATAATQTPRLPSTYNMPFPDMRGPGRAPLPRTASGHSGALSFRLPPRSPTATAPATPSVPSAQLLSEHAKVLGQLEGAEAARERAFLQNEERRARLFDEAEDRRRAEAEARRRVIEVWM